MENISHIFSCFACDFDFCAFFVCEQHPKFVDQVQIPNVIAF